MSSDTLTWDGNTSGLVMVDISGAMFYKVSGATPTMDDFVNGASVVNMVGAIATYAADGILLSYDGVLSTDAMEFLVIAEEAVGVAHDGIVFPEAGIYFMWIDVGIHTASLTIPGYTGFPM